ncbi:substrate-binding domain-containing protein [Arthrobacter sp. ISL-30]|uniref:substrate-binding domain-containing protein n=1 Tax=Arthrobacter sp. ISL-30 TaxID=2819109 RepID=UPI001BE4F656|nr:substrate-binding domain-containing protein [Arthrobacter sp. ISL-30]MBT2514628.1 substrate-binding domain-containing protein [Arthrobacter sp. ISL-30]
MRVSSSPPNRAGSDPASGAALSLFCAVGLRKAVEEAILPAFRRATETVVDVVCEPTNLLLQRVEAGARPGVFVGTRGSLEASASSGFFDLPSCKPVVKSGIGVAVPPDGSIPVPVAQSLP